MTEPPLPNYLRAFPRFPQAAMPAIPPGFEDVSWDREDCPVFIDSAFNLTLYVEHPERARRARPNEPRFVLCMCTDDDPPDVKILIESENWSDVDAAIKTARKTTPHV